MDSKLSLVPHGAILPSRAVRGRACVYERRGIRDLHALGENVYIVLTNPNRASALERRAASLHSAQLDKITARQIVAALRWDNADSFFIAARSTRANLRLWGKSRLASSVFVFG
jgi:hypothetical protein